MTIQYTRAQLTQTRAYRSVRRAGVAGEIGTAAFNIFTVANGPVLVGMIFGVVTTIIGAGPALPRIQYTPTGLALTPLCVAAADIATDAVGTLYCWDGLAASTLIPSAVLGVMGVIATSEWDGKYIMLLPGVMSVTDTTGAATTGVVDWYITYLPLLDTSIITAA